MRATTYRNNSLSKETTPFLSNATTTPDAIGNLSLWFKGDVGLVNDVNGNVTSWLDNSGNGNNASASGSGLITSANDVNGTYVNIHTDISKLNFGQVAIADTTIFILSKPTLAASNCSALLSSALDNSINVGEVSLGVLYNYKSDFNTTANMQSLFNSPPGVIPLLQVFETSSDALGQISYYAKDSNGVDFYERNFETLNPLLPNIDTLGGVNAVNKVDHGLYEVIIFGTKLTAKQHNDMLGYFNGKYGLTL